MLTCHILILSDTKLFKKIGDLKIKNYNQQVFEKSDDYNSL